MSNNALYKHPSIVNLDFPLLVYNKSLKDTGTFIITHWHEQIEFLMFFKGEALIRCGINEFHVRAGELAIINSNEIHSGENLSGNIEFACVVIDSSILQSFSFDSCEIKYITPIMQNLILFKNRIVNDDIITDFMRKIIHENETKNFGYELAIKASVLNILVHLLRNHLDKVLSLPEYNKRNKDIERLNISFKYIEENYNKDITSDMLAQMTHINKFYFCKIFKNMTNMTVTEYTNHIRIKKAEYLLKTTNLNVTEVALITGFNDINYFSRLFKKYSKSAPSLYRNVRAKTNGIPEI